jgi:hypothetical protein
VLAKVSRSHRHWGGLVTYTNRYLGTMALHQYLGITYRQMHSCVLEAGFAPAYRPHRGGKARRAVWEPEQIRRLEVATALARAAGRKERQSVLPVAVRGVFGASEGPPDEGWAILARDGSVCYALKGAQLAPMLVATMGGVVAQISDLWPADDPGGRTPEEEEERVAARRESGRLRTDAWRHRIAAEAGRES